MKVITTQPTGNQGQYLVTVDDDGFITSFITTPVQNTSNMAIYQNGIIDNENALDTAAQVNAQINGVFDGTGGPGSAYEFKLAQKYGDVSAYFTGGLAVTLTTSELDYTDPENPVPYPPLETTANSAYYSQDGVDDLGQPIYTVKVSINAAMGRAYDKIAYQV